MSFKCNLEKNKHMSEFCKDGQNRKSPMDECNLTSLKISRVCLFFFLSKMADVPEHFSESVQEKPEANHVQIIASQKKKKNKKGNVTCPF